MSKLPTPEEVSVTLTAFKLYKDSPIYLIAQAYADGKLVETVGRDELVILIKEWTKLNEPWKRGEWGLAEHLLGKVGKKEGGNSVSS